MTTQNEMIFGTRAVIEAIEAGKEIDKILIKKDLSSDLSRGLFAVLRDYDIPVQRVPMEKLNRLSRKNHQGVIAFISAVTYHRIADIVPQLYEAGKTPFIVVLDGVTDVRNFGAIARTCECAGVDAIVVPVRGAAAVNADAVKTSAGALHTLPVCREHNLLETIEFLKNSGIQIVAASEKAAQNYTEVDYSVPIAIVMGAEDLGVSPEILRISDHIVSIPIRGNIESLNVSVAAGILIYEALKARF